MSLPISVIIVTKNAAAHLAACLAALTDFDEILVVDSNSTDGTKNIALKHNAQYIPYEWNERYPKKRQWCLDNLPLKYDWIFFVDADEIVTPELAQEIEKIFTLSLRPNEERTVIRKDAEKNNRIALSQNAPRNDRIAGYFITGQYVWNGKCLKHGLQNCKIALFNCHYMHFPEIDDLDCPGMGEIEGHYQPVLKENVMLSDRKVSSYPKISSLKFPLLHYANHSPGEWLERHKRYAVWEICMNKKDAWPDDPVSWRNTLKKLLRHNPLRPELAFFHSYVLKRGFLDGVTGYNFAKCRWIYYKMILRGEENG